MKQGVIFDMDGTLWDSAENVAKSWNQVLAEKGLIKKELTKEDISGVMGKTMDAIADALFSELEKEARMQLLDECCERENQYLSEHGGVLYPGLTEALTALKEKYPLYIVSNCQKGYIEAFLEYYHFSDFFSDFECYGNNLLPKGENIKELSRRNGLECAVYVGDIMGDYEASKQAGVGFIHAAYGFGTVDADVPKIKHLRELPEAVGTFFGGKEKRYDEVR